MDRRKFGQLAAGAALGSTFIRAGAQTAPTPAVATPAPEQFNFSVMLWTIDRKLPFEQCLEIVAAAGYKGVELTGEFKHWSAADTTRMMAKMRSLGLTFDSIAGLRVTLADPAGSSILVRQLTEHIAVAKELESPQIILTSGPRMEGLPREVQHSACIENLKSVSDLLLKNDIQLVIEPIDLLEQKTGYLNSVTEGFEIAQAVGSPNVRVLYDFYHEQRASGNLIEKLEQNIDWVGLVHVADVPGRHDPGTGEIDYLNIYRKLSELNYKKFMAMEYYPTGDPLESLKTARLVAQQATRTRSAPYKFGSI